MRRKYREWRKKTTTPDQQPSTRAAAPIFRILKFDFLLWSVLNMFRKSFIIYFILLNTSKYIMNFSQHTHRGQLKRVASFSALENVTEPISVQRERCNRSSDTLWRATTEKEKKYESIGRKLTGRYQNKLVGDALEFCPLDAHLFSDYKRSVAMHCSPTSVYEHGDVQRLNIGAPDQVWSTLQRVWGVSPTPDRVKEDILAICGRIGKTIVFQGSLCPDEELRGLRLVADTSV